MRCVVRMMKTSLSASLLHHHRNHQDGIGCCSFLVKFSTAILSSSDFRLLQSTALRADIQQVGASGAVGQPPEPIIPLPLLPRQKCIPGQADGLRDR